MHSCKTLLAQEQRRIIFDNFWAKGGIDSGDHITYRQLKLFDPVQYGNEHLDYQANEYNAVFCYLTPTDAKKASDSSIFKRYQRFNARQSDSVQYKKNMDRDLDVRTVRFNPRVGVQLYSSIFPKKKCAEKNSKISNEPMSKPNSTWYTNRELTSFRLEALAVVRQHENNFGSSKNNRKPLFKYPALKVVKGDRHYIEGSDELKMLLKMHIKRVLIIEPHPIFCDIYVRSIKKMFPHVSISTAKNSVDAVKQIDQMPNLEEKITIEKKRRSDSFDIIIVEERLSGQRIYCENKENVVNSPTKKSLSGSEILRKIKTLCSSNEKKSRYDNHVVSSQYNDERKIHYSDLMCASNRLPLLIGTSSYLGEDCPQLARSGADVLWGKPPPKMDEVLRNELLTTLLQKRGLSDVICG